MKKIIKNIIIAAFFICSPLFMNNIFADQPPNPGGGPGGGDDPVGGGAPIGSGLALLVTMGMAYGGKKVFDARNKLMK